MGGVQLELPGNDKLDEERGPSSSANEEIQPLNSPSSVQPLNNPGMTNSKRRHLNLLERLMLNVDERVSVKVLMHIWGPRLEFVVRLMLVATFLDDSLRMAMHFSQHVEQVSQGGVLGWLGATASPTLAIVVATASLGTGLLAQSLGSLCLLALVRPDAAATALIAWAMVQPVLYAQLSNLEFLSESISVLGGLLMLRVHLISAKRRRLASAPSGKALDSVADSSLALARLLGRLLLPAAYIHRAGIYLLRAFALDETADVAAFLSSLSAFAINVALLAGLVVASFLVAAGLKSRTVALALAAANLCYTAYSHPFLALLRREGGAWAVDEDAVWSDAAAAGGASPADLTPWQIYDLHRYYFFLGLSTSGALLLLAQLGPGTIAVQRNELLLPVVARARD